MKREQLGLKRERTPADQFAQLVEESGAEIGVTLLVNGVLIEGILTPLERWTEWTVAALSGTPNRQAARAPALTQEESEKLKKNWERRYAHLKGNVELTYDRICLRNATIQTVPNPEYWPTWPYMLIETLSIDAFTLGTSRSHY